MAALIAKIGVDRLNGEIIKAVAVRCAIIGDKKEINRAIWRKPRGTRLTATSRYIVDRFFPDD